MAVGERVTVTMTGGGPWGFRLYGGEFEPLVVAKLRQRSKASNSGMCEGDVLLGINSHSCLGMSHSKAMGLVDTAGQTITMLVLRGTSDKNAIHAAFQELGSQLKSAPASTQPQPRSTSQTGGQRSQFPSQSASHPAAQPQFQVQVKTAGDRHPLINGYAAGDPHSNISREEQTYHEGDTTRHVTTERKTENVGGTTVTRVTRKEVSQTGGYAPVPQPHFQAKKPAVWAPAGGPTGATSAFRPAGLAVSAPSGVQVQQNPDQSVTMTIGMGGFDEGKENVAPMFQVTKVIPEKAKPDRWQPTSASVPFRPSPRPQDTNIAPAPAKQWAPPGQTSKPTALPFLAQLQNNIQQDEPDSYEPPRHIDLARILMGDVGSGSDECSTPESPGSAAHRKKKIYADSAFYDDPSKKYPTIEEQIKMARKVALSLTAPQNVSARGHNMFMKRRQKSSRWVAGIGPMEEGPMSEESSEDEKYYNPNPWAPTHTWQPPKQTYGGGGGGVSMQFTFEPPKLEDTSRWKAPVLPTGADEEKNKALSAEEFERLRLYEQKTMHNQVAPQVCFSLANDLRMGKGGKGGKLFAKRRAKAEQWVVDEKNVQIPQPNPELLARLAGSAPKPNQEDQPMGPREPGGMPTNRLVEMIDPPKAAMTPWEAAAKSPYGSLDPAFEHLKGYKSMKFKSESESKLISNLSGATNRQDASSSSSFSLSSNAAPPSSQSNIPNYNRKIKGWGPGGASPASSVSSAPAMHSASPGTMSPDRMSSPARYGGVEYKNPHPKPWQSGGDAAATPYSQPPVGASSGGGFRPLKFQTGHNVGVFDPAGAAPAAQWQPQGASLAAPEPAPMPGGSPLRQSPMMRSPMQMQQSPMQRSPMQQSPMQRSPMHRSPAFSPAQHQASISPHHSSPLAPSPRGPSPRGPSPLAPSPLAHSPLAPSPREVTDEEGMCDL